MISIAVVAGDPITGEGAVWCLRRYPGLNVLSQEEHRHADVVLMITPEVTEETMLLMESVAARSTSPGMGIVLVTGHIGEAHLLRAVHHGLRGVMWRHDSTYDRIVEAVRAVAEGGAALPPPVQGELVDHLLAVQRDVLAPLGLTTSGLEVREVDVLRLLAEGLDTTEIARKLNYSERTIKNILSVMMNRLGLRNRTHAVAYALRSGML
ncbi:MULTISPECIES: response regulator transcription factor [Streptomyces]|uniref:Response regulator transcription factor n=1 Tax=Streptomyces gilvifuscus TaxID=1550617 RepID=A0ABT5G4H3_9ACTN|nr:MULTISPECIES: response regulator transcription factor [Streptomyces]MBK3646308.1 response regulator transcription factor [Streptomyces sp. MBT33]MDC2959605.1 response regulator transcription factor [Streptomyces gilvifuscus]